VTNPLRCLGEMLATFVGRALGGTFSCSARPAAGKRCIVEVRSWRDDRSTRCRRETGVAWLDEAGTDHVAVRISRSVGLPAPRPDILGMALRIATQPGQFGDVLLATTGTGLLGRYVLLPTRRHGLRAYTSLFPYRTLAGPLLLAAIPTAGSPRQYELAYARPTGPWLPFATLEITQTTYRGHDVDLSLTRS
jgi:hypothetical protein